MAVITSMLPMMVAMMMMEMMRVAKALVTVKAPHGSSENRDFVESVNML